MIKKLLLTFGAVVLTAGLVFAAGFHGDTIFTTRGNDLTIAPSGGDTAITGTLTTSGAVTKTGGDITAAVAVTDAATYTVLAANSGKLHIMPDLTADTVITLPAIAAGLDYTFVYGGVAADAQDWQLDTSSDTNFYLGGFVELDTSGDTVVLEAGDGNSNSIVNIFTPAGGTSVRFYCDGTNWWLSGTVHSDTADGVTWADQS